MDQTAEQAEPQQSSDHLLRDGIILAILLPLLGAIWAIRLFARDRIGAGLAVLVTALVVLAVYLVVFLPLESGPSYSAYSSSIKSEIETTLRERIQNAGEEGTITELSCVAQSSSVMKCLAQPSIQGEYGSSTQAQAIYEVTIDRARGTTSSDSPRSTRQKDQRRKEGGCAMPLAQLAIVVPAFGAVPAGRAILATPFCGAA